MRRLGPPRACGTPLGNRTRAGRSSSAFGTKETYCRTLEVPGDDYETWLVADRSIRGGCSGDQNGGSQLGRLGLRIVCVSLGVIGVTVTPQGSRPR